MTSNEAKTKWCPFTRVALTAGMSANRTATMGRGGYADIEEETRCLGNACAAWHEEYPNDVTGYCGLTQKRD